MSDQLLYHIAITSIPNIGDITAKKLIAYCGSSEQVFKEKKSALEKIPGIGGVNAVKIIQHKTEALTIAEEELKFIKKDNIKPLFYLNENYPKRLFHCEDGPILIYTKGNLNLNNPKVISIVGTRKATDYGKEFCNKIVEDLVPHQPLIVSGLAYGIDICSHKASLKNNIDTVGVLAHGLDRIYPQQHMGVSRQMLEKGGLLTDYKSGTNPDRENFPKRNRIIAGLSDLTIVIESSKKGGSLITAYIANDYNRDVFALPGRLSDGQSEGCNNLIKSHKAALIQSAKDIEYIMGWETKKKIKPNQPQLFIELTPEQKIIVNIISKQDKIGIDELSLQAKLPMSKTSSMLLEMEFSGVVKTLPGKIYKLV
ncbi:MAG: DNA-protecting protein DprA [Flavobacteriales bacterium]|nr:MAG: DNA-protecting protein DprA [Flavobacteriales bacterium]